MDWQVRISRKRNIRYMSSNYIEITKPLLIHMAFDFRALHGFLTRQQTEEYLNKSPNGTFLIRFSDSEPGGVTIAWITGEKHFEY